MIRTNGTWIMCIDVDGETREVHGYGIKGCIRRANKLYGKRWTYNTHNKAAPTKQYFKQLGVNV